MNAVIMAGGKGSRLSPLTDHAPKPMMPIIDKPILQYIIELLRKHGIYDISVTLGYMAGNIVQAFGDGRDLGVKLHYFIEKEPLGTAGGVKAAECLYDIARHIPERDGDIVDPVLTQ